MRTSATKRLLLALALTLSARGTIEGLGRDISDGARTVRRAF